MNSIVNRVVPGTLFIDPRDWPVNNHEGDARVEGEWAVDGALIPTRDRGQVPDKIVTGMVWIKDIHLKNSGQLLPRRGSFNSSSRRRQGIN